MADTAAHLVERVLPEVPERKITAFKEIVSSAETSPSLSFVAGKGGRVRGSSSYFQWLMVTCE